MTCVQYGVSIRVLRVRTPKDGSVVPLCRVPRRVAVSLEAVQLMPTLVEAHEACVALVSGPQPRFDARSPAGSFWTVRPQNGTPASA